MKTLLDEVEMEVMQSIKGSEALQKFLQSAENLAEEVNDELLEMIDGEHSLIENKVSTSKFAYLVIKHTHYNKLDT